MSKWWDEIRLDLEFIRSHELQPGWYKILKSLILLGILTAHYLFFGPSRTLMFFGVFLLLMGLVHWKYRRGTHKWRRSWLDFVVVQEDNQVKAKSIGRYYYAFILINAIIAALLSRILK